MVFDFDGLTSCCVGLRGATEFSELVRKVVEGHGEVGFVGGGVGLGEPAADRNGFVDRLERLLVGGVLSLV